MNFLKFCEKAIIKKTDTEPRVTLRLYYPYCDEEGRAAARVNSLMESLVCSYAKRALEAKEPAYLSHELSYRIAYNDGERTTIYFELEKRGANGRYAYRPFSVSFDVRGNVLPSPYPHTLRLYKKVREAFAARGIRLSKKQFLYSFRLSPGGAVVYAPLPPREGRCRRGVYEVELAGTMAEQ